MADLIKPNKEKHEYVVGIDFGHGETSAAVYAIEWEKEAGKKEGRAEDVDLDVAARKKVITSAICRVKDGVKIGDEAFEHMTDNNGISICFKQKPKSLDGDAEGLMIDYMKAIYARIRESRDELKDGNHIVYIARPSGWVEEEAKELYRLMALKAGIPLAGLTSESRAAIFYAKNPDVGFAKEISEGAVVFDLGSSTLDFTYLSDKSEPVDFGYDVGASIIDEAILENKILSNSEVNEFVEKYPQYRDALKFKARKFKEEAYGRNPDIKTTNGFDLDSIIDEGEESYDDYADIHISLKIKNIQELNDMINESKGYIDRMAEAIDDFKGKHIPGKKVNGVFLTGGASRMNFIRPLVAQRFSLPQDKVKIDKDNPSLTISRGIALLGATDAITDVMVRQFKVDASSLFDSDKSLSDFVEKLSHDIASGAWEKVEDTCQKWVNYGRTTDIEELKEKMQKSLKRFQNDKVRKLINCSLEEFLIEGGEDIRKRMNEIISRYAPGREIVATAKVQIGDMSAIDESLDSLSEMMDDVCNSITSIVGDVLWAVLGFVLWGVYAIPYYLIKGAYNKFFRDDKDKRNDKVKKILEKESEIISKIEEEMNSKLKENSVFKDAVSKSLNTYFVKLIDDNLQQVIIPIE